MAFKAEFLTFLNNCYIVSKESGITCLGDHIWGSQERMLDEIFSGLQEGKHDFKTLKSRQLGCSTFARAFALFWLGVHDGLQGACILDSDLNKESARREIVTMIENLPAEVKFPRIKSQNRYGITLENNSKLHFLSAGNKKGQSSSTLGASLGLNFLICSEMCAWANVAGVEALKPSLSKTFPNRLYIWESTARGPNLWQDMWHEAVNDDITQRTIFLGWWARDDQRLKKGTPLYAKYAAAPLTKKEHERIAAVKEKYGVDIDLEQLAWYRQHSDPNQDLEQDESEDPLKTQEQPWTEEEAFQITGSSFFSPSQLSRLMGKTEQPIACYRFSHGVEFQQTTIEKARSLRETQLKVWEEPVSESHYIVAADPAFGHNPLNNNSAIQVLRCYADRMEQVAEFGDSETPTHQFAWVIAAIVGYYAVGPNGTFKNNVEVIIEINGPGDAVLKAYREVKATVEAPYNRVEMKERGIKNIFQNVRNYIYQRTDTYNRGEAIMWKTNQQLKESSLERLRDFAYSDVLLIRSMAAIQEMTSIVRDEETIGAPGMKRDDKVISLAMATRSWDDGVKRRLMQEGKTKQRDEEKRKITPADKFAIFNRNQLDSMFKKSASKKLAQAREDRYKAWRFR
ncbi:MAG: hypothetical protein E6R03_12955 [Hyphomicrobiaceae bacterium]|nr:MAG: hypothetical protein E6R03_12955 [Hyphomicrobiaceae bacterium]